MLRKELEKDPEKAGENWDKWGGGGQASNYYYLF